MSTYQFELALRRYVAAFNGKNVSLADFKTRFDNIYHKDFTFLSKDGHKLPRDVVYEREVQKFTSHETKVTLIHYRMIGLDCIDAKLGLVTGDEERTVRAVSTLSSGKAVISKEIDESHNSKFLTPKQVAEAKGTNFLYKWREFGTFQTNM